METSTTTNNKAQTTPTLTTKAAAKLLGVSTATIHNWTKNKLLEKNEHGHITQKSLKRFQKHIAGKSKLTQRANKTCKDSHNHTALADRFLNSTHETLTNTNINSTVGVEYESSLSNAYRNKEGIYYTPEKIISNLFQIDPSINVQNMLFCDPCCGSGNFIVQALKLGFRAENIYGYDTDPIAVHIAQLRIKQLTGYKSNNIKIANFLEINAGKSHSQKFDYIYTNPPWGKKISKEARKKIGDKVNAGTSIDTCSLFFFACLQHLKNGGKLGLLLPQAFFNIASFEDARKKALQLTIERLIDYDNVFKGLLTKAQGIVIQNTPTHQQQHATVSCEITPLNHKKNNITKHKRCTESFAHNPKAILNLHCNEEDALTIQHLISLPHITLKNQVHWGLGMVTGNNSKYVKTTAQKGDIPVFKGCDIVGDTLRETHSFINPDDISTYQQVAPRELYEAKEKLIYKFISSHLCFYYDNQQRYILNSANMLIPKKTFPISAKTLTQILNSELINWLFIKLFHTYKVLRSDLETLPIHHPFLDFDDQFNENTYIKKLGIIKNAKGDFRVK